MRFKEYIESGIRLPKGSVETVAGSIIKPSNFCSNMHILNPSDMHHLRAAEGWLDLGNLNESRSELELIPSPQRNHPKVLELWWNLSAKEKNWKNCVKTAQLLVESAPNQPAGWIHRSFALHELNQTEEAFTQLEPAQNLFSDQWVIPYNLACYLSQLGRIKEAAQQFESALSIDSKAVKMAAATDPDLKPLRQSIDQLRNSGN